MCKFPLRFPCAKNFVEDDDSWRVGFDEHASILEEYGSSEDYRQFRQAASPNEVMMMDEWESADTFQRFMEESDVTENLGEFGVVSEPEVYVLEEIEANAPERPLA